MKKQTKAITLHYKEEIETSDDSNWECFEKFFGKNISNEANSPDTIILSGKGDWEREADHIEIDAVIDILKKLKNNGCNYVEIMNHTDHRNYVFNGIDIQISTPEEIENYREKRQKHQDAQKRIEELQKEIKKIQNETR